MENKLFKIKISMLCITKLIKNELINNYPHLIFNYILNKDKSILLFFAKTISMEIKKLEEQDFKNKNEIEKDFKLWI